MEYKTRSYFPKIKGGDRMLKKKSLQSTQRIFYLAVMVSTFLFLPAVKAGSSCYDCGCFMYERPGSVGHWPFIYYREGKCLMPGGYVDHGNCYCIPPSSRNYLPDYYYPYDSGTTYFWTDSVWYTNLYSDAQGWSGKSFAYTAEFRIPSWGSFTGWYSTLPNAQSYLHEVAHWACEDTWEFEIWTPTPEQIQTYTVYYADVYVDLGGNAVSEYMVNEGEIKDDRWPWSWLHPGGVPLDWYKLYIGSHWAAKGINVYGDPEEVAWMLEIKEFPGGGIVVRKFSSTERVTIRVESNIESEEDLIAYVNSRTQAMLELIDTVDPFEYIPVTITFKTLLKPINYITLSKAFGIKVLEYSFVCEKGLGGRLLGETEQLYDWNFEKIIEEARDDKVIGIIAIKGLLQAGKISPLQRNPRVLLIDPKEDLDVQELVEKYEPEASQVTVEYPAHIWTED